MALLILQQEPRHHEMNGIETVDPRIHLEVAEEEEEEEEGQEHSAAG